MIFKKSGSRPSLCVSSALQYFSDKLHTHTFDIKKTRSRSVASSRSCNFFREPILLEKGGLNFSPVLNFQISL